MIFIKEYSELRAKYPVSPWRTSLFLLRSLVAALPRQVSVVNTPSYSGCLSTVPQQRRRHPAEKADNH